MLKSSDPLSFEDLGAIYRTEKKSPTVSAVRRDLYPAMAALILTLRTEYEKQLSTDPDSIICEGVNQRRKKAVQMSKEITEIRMGKIAQLALIGARGGQNVLDHLTSEEREYYDGILDISRKHVGIVDKLSGKRKFETPDIDPEPVVKKKAPEPIKAEPAPAEEPVAKPAPAPEPVPKKKTETAPKEPVKPVTEPVPEPIPEPVPEPIPEPVPEEELLLIRVLEDLPPFSGPDRNYVLSKEDVVRMPKAMAMALVTREKAVVINPGP